MQTYATELKRIKSVLMERIEDGPSFADNPLAWLKSRQGMGDHAFLLAFADDGIIWGSLDSGKLTLSGDVFPKSSPEFHAQTLWRVHLFSNKAEIRVWKQDGGFQAVRIEDGPDGAEEHIDEEIILWGDSIAEGPEQGFTWMQDGAQGLRHAPPVSVSAADLRKANPSAAPRHPLRLVLRRYVNYLEEDGQAYIQAWRLVDLRKE